mgnify:CR=1 FL=1
MWCGIAVRIIAKAWDCLPGFANAVSDRLGPTQLPIAPAAAILRTRMMTYFFMTILAVDFYGQFETTTRYSQSNFSMWITLDLGGMSGKSMVFQTRFPCAPRRHFRATSAIAGLIHSFWMGIRRILRHGMGQAGLRLSDIPAENLTSKPS